MSAEPIITLSTSFLHRKVANGYEMMCKAAELGFKHVELGHTTTLDLVDGIERALKEGIVKVASLHNFCPIPAFARPPAPNLYSPATSSKAESSQWIRHTKNTITFAQLTSAERIVTHAGALWYFWLNPTFLMQALFDEYEEAANVAKMLDSEIAEIASPDEVKFAEFKKAQERLTILEKKYAMRLKKFIASSEKKAKKAHDKIFENLEKINVELEEKNVLLGIENRDGLSELPFDTLFADFTKRLQSFSKVRGWIDIGHAQIKHLRGVIEIESFLDSTRGNICGWHLHDCTDSGKDHCAIGKGSINFDLVKKYFEPQTQIFTLELSARASEQDAIESRKKMEDMF